ncbi:MAG: hypothetical protein M3T56_17885, partial [Chloroflexota bacterium]|nr:hypothetical protein [Chloroflexota bacterium]
GDDQAGALANAEPLTLDPYKAKLSPHSISYEDPSPDPAAIVLSMTGLDPWLEIPVGTAIRLPKDSTVVVEIEVQTRIPGEYQVFFGIDDRPFTEPKSRRFKVRPTPGWNRLTIEAPGMGPGLLTRLRFDPPNEATTGRIELRNVRVGVKNWLDPSSNIDSRLELRYLPDLWARRDPFQALSQSVVLRDLTNEVRRAASVGADAPITMTPGQQLIVPIAPLYTTGPTYLDVTASADREATLSISYQKAAIAATGNEFLSFIVTGNGAVRDFLLRPSIQRAWIGNASPVTSFMIANDSDTTITLHQLTVRSGD